MESEGILNTMCQWTFMYQPEGMDIPLGFKYVSFAEDNTSARTTAYVHWLVTLLIHGQKPPGLEDD